MSARIRGQEATVNFAVAGIGLLEGEFAKVREFTATTRTDLVESSYLGEVFDDLDVQHHGWDFSFTIDAQDGQALTYIKTLMNNEEASAAPASVVMQVQLNYREAGVDTKTLLFTDVVMKANEIALPSRKEYVNISFEGKAKRMTVQ